MNVGLLGKFMYVTYFMCTCFILNVIYAVWLWCCLPFIFITCRQEKKIWCMELSFMYRGGFHLWNVETLQVVRGQWNVGITEYKCRFWLWKVKINAGKRPTTKMPQCCWSLELLVNWHNIFSCTFVTILGNVQCIGEEECVEGSVV